MGPGLESLGATGSGGLSNKVHSVLLLGGQGYQEP